jgi:hypothetical protein
MQPGCQAVSRLSADVSFMCAFSKTVRMASVVALVLLLFGCDHSSLRDSLIPKAESEAAKETLARLRGGDLEYIKERLHPDVSRQASDEKLRELAEYFPRGEPISTTLIGSQVHTMNSLWQGNFSFEYEFQDGWALANAVLQRSDDDLRIVGLSVYRTDASQKEINRFTLAQKSPIHYVVFTLAIVVPLFILVTFVFCIRTPIRRKKWLWMFFVLLGVGSLQLNWTTGEYAIQLMSFNLVGAGAMASGPYGPWIFSIGVPLGAILFWARREKLITKHEANNTNEPDA